VVQGMKEIVLTLLIAIALVILVVYLFLQGWRATLIPLLAVPVSLIGTFAVFPLFGFSVNTLSLFGLVLAIGLVVDDAIVVVEAVERHIEEGMAPKEAALKAMEDNKAPFPGFSSRMFFDALLQITMEGFFADPIYGGNHDMAGWKMVGYPGLPATYREDIKTYFGKKYDKPPRSIADFT